MVNIIYIYTPLICLDSRVCKLERRKNAKVCLSLVASGCRLEPAGIPNPILRTRSWWDLQGREQPVPIFSQLSLGPMPRQQVRLGNLTFQPQPSASKRTTRLPPQLSFTTHMPLLLGQLHVSALPSLISSCTTSFLFSLRMLAYAYLIFQFLPYRHLNHILYLL